MPKKSKHKKKLQQEDFKVRLLSIRIHNDS